MVKALKEKTEEDKSKQDRFILDTRINCFGERLKTAMKGESNNSFAKRCGMSERVIRNYLDGSTYPSIDRLAVLAQVSGSSLNWLATGECDLDKNADITKMARIEAHKTEKGAVAWLEIWERMAPLEREALLSKIVRHGISSLLEQTETKSTTTNCTKNIINLVQALPEAEQREILLTLKRSIQATTASEEADFSTREVEVKKGGEVKKTA